KNYRIQAKNYERSAQIARSESLGLMRDTRDKARKAAIMLHSGNTSSAARINGQRLLDEVVTTYDIKPDGRWMNSPKLAHLTDDERRALLIELGDVFLSRSKAELQFGKDRKDQSCREPASQWNQLSETCFTSLG